MKSSKPLALAIGVVAMAATTMTLVTARQDSRSVGPVRFAGVLPPSTGFVRAESTGLFVGVAEFAHDATLSVPYAVDDAVDLAHKLSLGQRSSLVPPRRVVLALSGKPQKEESQQRLRELKDAGARIENASSGDILSLLKEQTRRAGANGLVVLSLATHGFLDAKGDPYILGSTSAIGSPETSLRTATLFDIAGRATRSLIFVDACRDRIGQASRSAGPDPATAAPLIRKMSGVRGQVIFYAAAPGNYAYDDAVHRNGVFTKAVLDGLSCKASAPRGEVIAETLHRYVDSEVQRWIAENNKPAVHAATQVSMEGETRNMPLAECWRTPGRCSRVATDDSTITVYDDETRPLWRKTFGEKVVHAEVADLDADAFCEVIVGLHDRIIVFDRDGRPLRNRGGAGMLLRTFTSGDLFRKHTNQIVALWNDEPSSTSRVTVIDSVGNELSNYEHAGLLQHVTIGRPTNMHAPKIVVAGLRRLFLLDSKKLARGPLWRQELVNDGDVIENLTVLEADNDSRRDITVSTTSGTTWFDFDGRILRRKQNQTSSVEPRWNDVSRTKRRGQRE